VPGYEFRNWRSKIHVQQEKAIGPRTAFPFKERFMRYKLYGFVAVIIGVLFAASPMPAHHAFAAEFDANKCTDLTGTFTAFEWDNPHGYFHMDVKDSSGTVNSWSFETISVPALKRSGTSRRDFENAVGKTVTVRACLSKNGAKNRAAAETIKLPDGQVHRIGQDVEGRFKEE
jgi:hypothetical protein